MAEARKTVTIVFADVTGSTALGEQMDPEALRRVMERYFEEMRIVLERHGGMVEKFIGDAVMAVFGIPTVHEDDALRAVRAAAGMRDRLAALNKEFARERGVTITVRTGVNTGEVLAGDPVHGQAFATGDAVNVAARLEQAAQPGEILLGETTHHLVRDAARVELLEPLELKGKTGAAQAWRLIEALPDVPGFKRRLDAPFVGRSEELRALHDVFKRSHEGGRAELVTIVAPAGMGKSRLARELVATIDRDARVVVGRCLPYGEGITYWPLAEIIRQVAGEDVRAGLEQLLASEEDGNLVAAHVAAAVGVGDTPSRSEEIAWATRRVFEVLAHARPLVVVADDIHWAEPTLLDLVEYVVGFAAAPLLVVCLARPDLFEARPSWSVPRPQTTALTLAPLTDDMAEALVEALASGGEVSAGLRRQIVERADGNPLFVEQMLAHARESGNGDVAVPPTIQALLTARIDGLEPGERAVAEHGAVEGRLFHRGAVASLLPEDQQDGVNRELMSLVRKELIRPDHSEFPGDDGFRFVHILVRDAAYAAIPKQRRADLHERYSNWLEQRAAARLPEIAELVGYHLEQAYHCRKELGPVDDKLTELGRRAAQKLGVAGRRALDRGDVTAAAKLLQRGSDLLPPTDAARLEMAPLLADALFDSGQPAEAASLLERALSAAGAIGSDRLSTLIWLNAAALEIQMNPDVDSDGILERAHAAVERFERQGDELIVARAWGMIEQVEWTRGRLSASRAAAEQGLLYAERLGDLRLQGEFRQAIGGAQFFGDVPVETCIETIEEQLRWARMHGVVWMEGIALQALGRARLEQGNLAEAAAESARGRELLDALGMLITNASLQGALSQGKLAIEPDAVEARIRAAYETLKATGEKGVFSTVTAELAQVVYAKGDYAEAERLSCESEETGSPDDVVTQVGWRAARAIVLARRGQVDDAEALARDALERALATEYMEATAQAYLGLGEVLRLAGRMSDAGEAIEEAVALFERKGFVLSADAVRAKLGAVQSAVGSPSQ